MDFCLWNGRCAGGAEELQSTHHSTIKDEKFYIIGGPFLTWKKIPSAITYILIIRPDLMCSDKGWHQLSQWAESRKQIVAQAVLVPSVLPEKSYIHFTARNIKRQAVCSHPTGKTRGRTKFVASLHSIMVKWASVGENAGDNTVRD